MQQYKLSYSKTYAQVLVLAVTPFAVIFVLGIPFVMLLPHLPDWGFYIGAFAIIAAALSLTLYGVSHWAIVPATLTLSNEGVQIDLDHNSPFYHFKSKKFSWGSVKNASANFDASNDKAYYTLKTHHPSSSMILLPIPADASIDEFAHHMTTYIDFYNNTAANGHQITHRGFYDSVWAKWMTYIDIALMVLFGVLYYFHRDTMQYRQVLVFYIFSASWLVNYYTARVGSKH